MIEKLKPPPDFTKKDKIYVPKHHSVADWDFEQGALYRSLSAVQYVSAPTSLRIYKSTGSVRKDTILCRVNGTLCLPQGELRTWLRWNTYAQKVAVFRNQAVLGTANLTNCYYVDLADIGWTLHRVIAGSDTSPGFTDASSTSDTWEHWRVIYWNGLTPELDEAICVELYKEVAEEWVKQGETLYDTANQWKDSEINRSGFQAVTGEGHPQYWDDTEIWGPA